MPEDSTAKSPTGPSGLHANAAPFVPVAAAAAKGDKAQDGKLSTAAGNAAASSSNSAAAALNGAVSAAGSTGAAGDKGSTSSNQPAAAAAAATTAGKGGAPGGKGQKGGAKQQQASSSKLAAAASAAPFVPGKSGAAANASTSGSAAKEQKQQQGKEGARGRQNNQRQERTRQQQKEQQPKEQQQQKEQQQKEQQQQQQQQQKEPLQQKEQQQKDQKEQKEAKEQKAAGTGRMSAAAAAFVPKTSAPAAATPSAATSSSNSSQQQQQRAPAQSSAASSAAAAAAAAASRLKSPLKGGPAGGSTSSSSALAAVHASPARAAAAASSGSRAGRGGRVDSAGSSRGSSNLGPGGPGVAVMGPPLGALPGMYAPPGGRGLPHGAAGLGPGAGGPKRALLAQFQGSYQYGPGAGMMMMGGGQFGGGYNHHHHAAAPGKQLLSAQFMSEGLRQQLQQANYLTQLQYTPAADEAPLPDKIGHYHTLYSLEDLAAADTAGMSNAWGVHTNVFKGISTRDGRAYALRVVCGKQVIPSVEMLSVVRSAVDLWSCLAGHPGLLVPVEGFVASELDGSPSLVVVHLYVPGAVTLAQAHLQPTQTASGQLVRNTPNEELLWSYTVQLAGILRAAHAKGLALRPAALSATKVLLTPVGRLKVCGLGVSEALTGEVVPANQEDLLQLQRDDVVAMGQLLLQLACAVGGLPAPSLDFASLHYSPEFVRLLLLLLGVADGGSFSWRAVSALLGERLLLEMDSLAMFNEQLLADLSQEMENGRLFRLVSKLSFVTDRATEGASHAGGSPAYADSGDPYLLGLFRDFVFHQAELDGGRVLDWGHLVECLNKLDAGVSEQVLLQSRDERSLLVVSYADVKRAVEAAVVELRTRGSSQPAGGMMRTHGGPTGVGHMFGMGGR